jgi:hypothetical protein
MGISGEYKETWYVFLLDRKFPHHASVRQNPGSWYETTFMLLYISV